MQTSSEDCDSAHHIHYYKQYQFFPLNSNGTLNKNLSRFVCLFVCLLRYWCFKLRAYPLNHSTSLFFVMVFLR
jgi:hypothetical protein